MSNVDVKGDFQNRTNEWNTSFQDVTHKVEADTVYYQKHPIVAIMFYLCHVWGIAAVHPLVKKEIFKSNPDDDARYLYF